MITLIIFDLSGVLFSLEEQPFVEKFAHAHGFEPTAFYKRYIELTNQSETGIISGVDVWNTLSKELNFTVDPQTVIATMLNTKEKYDEMLTLVKTLKERYLVVFLTNYNKEYWAVLKNRFDFTEFFHWGVVSYEIGSRKPAKECFLHILEKAQCTPRDTVFIDDSAKNLFEAQALGIHTLLFRSKEKLITDLASLGVSV